MMEKIDDLVEQRLSLATLCGMKNISNDDPLEQAPCNMPLGDAILQLAAAHEEGVDTSAALVVWRGGVFDERACLYIANQYGDRLASSPAT